MTIPLECTWLNWTMQTIPWHWATTAVPGPGPGPYPPSNYDSSLEYTWYAACKASTNPVQVSGGTVTSETSLHALDVLEPAPAGHSCTVASVTGMRYTLTPWDNLATWVVDDRAMAGRAGKIGVAHAGLGVTRSLRLDSGRMVPYTAAFDADAWYPAERDGGENNTWFQIDLSTGYFAMNDTWVCDDKDAGHP